MVGISLLAVQLSYRYAVRGRFPPRTTDSGAAAGLAWGPKWGSKCAPSCLLYQSTLPNCLFALLAVHALLYGALRQVTWVPSDGGRLCSPLGLSPGTLAE